MGANINNIWFPTNGIQNNDIELDCNKTRLIKSEDEYITTLQDSNKSLDYKIAYIKSNKLEKYQRFINENNLAISKYLYNKEIEGDFDDFINSEYCKPYTGELIMFDVIDKSNKKIYTM